MSVESMPEPEPEQNQPTSSPLSSSKVAVPPIAIWEGLEAGRQDVGRYVDLVSCVHEGVMLVAAKQAANRINTDAAGAADTLPYRTHRADGFRNRFWDSLASGLCSSAPALRYYFMEPYDKPPAAPELVLDATSLGDCHTWQSPLAIVQYAPRPDRLTELAPQSITLSRMTGDLLDNVSWAFSGDPDIVAHQDLTLEISEYASTAESVTAFLSDSDSAPSSDRNRLFVADYARTHQFLRQFCILQSR